MADKKFIAVIPARGGSKRFPGKNIYPLAGIPLIAYPIRAAKEAKGIGRIIVSTDDEKIAAVAREHGAEIPFMRPKELAEDSSSVIDAVIHTVQELERRENYHADYTILLQPATPLVTPDQIEQAIGLAVEKSADSVVTVAQVDTVNHPFNIREIRGDGTIGFWQEALHYEYYATKPKPKFYHAANLWLSSHDTLVKKHRLEGERNYPVIVDRVYASDIDYKEDLELIEAYLRYHAEKR